MKHNLEHKTHRINWLRAAVMGANDGIISISSLIVGVAAADLASETVMFTGLAGLTAGALSMASGEYVSVSSQSDIETAEIALEKKHLEDHPQYEKNELADIYIERGVEAELAMQVADQLMKKDALGAHLQDELGISLEQNANPLNAALTSAITFTVGGGLPLLSYYLAQGGVYSVRIVALSTLFYLALLGALAAWAGGASRLKGATRVTFWGMLAMGLTYLVGRLFEVAV